MEYNYDNILGYIRNGRNKTNRPTDYKPNNTRFIIHKHCVGVKYHDTVILTYYPNDAIQFNTDGWKTVTTKDRLNHFQNEITIWQDKSIWYFKFNHEDGDYLFIDNMMIHNKTAYASWIDYADGKTMAPLQLSEHKKRLKLKRDINKYCDEFIEKFFNREIPEPSFTDCFICGLEDDSSDHILSHIEEECHVPRLLYNAMNEFKSNLAPIDKHNVACMWYDPNQKHEMIYSDISKQHIKTCLKRYIYKRLGFAIS
jgi:hypothetical protein